MKEIKKWSNWKKFLMSLLATTVSIVLTFGTTAIIDRKKQRAEKREMVLMVMYDMRESLKECEQCQVNLRAFCDAQVDLVAHPEKLAAHSVELLIHVPILTYTTTTENIFRSNIETIRTIGNILLSRPSPLSMTNVISTTMRRWQRFRMKGRRPRTVMRTWRHSMLLTSFISAIYIIRP